MSDAESVPPSEEDQTQLKLAALYLAREQAIARLTMAQQTVTGAQAAAMDADARFKGVMEFVYGPNYTFEWRDGKLLVDAQGNLARKPADQDGLVVMNGAVPNRAARRALAKNGRK